MIAALGGILMAAEPERIELQLEERAVTPVNALQLSNLTTYTGSGPSYTERRYWAEEPSGRNLPAADFARLVGEPALEAEISSAIARRRALATPLLVGGIIGWVSGAALLLSTFDEGYGDGMMLGVLGVMGGQGSVATSIALFSTNRARSRNLHPWIEWEEARSMADRYNGDEPDGLEE